MVTRGDHPYSTQNRGLSESSEISNAGPFVDKTFRIRRFADKLGRFVDRCIKRSDTWF